MRASTTAPTRTPPTANAAVPHDFVIGRAIWPLLLASFLATVPTTAISMFTPTIAADLDTTVSVVGGLRVVLGAAALACGALFAPLVDRLPRAWTIGGALVGLALACGMATQSSLTGIVFFYGLAGAAGAMLQPSLQSAAADGLTPAVGARAASLLSGIGGLAPMLAGPLLAIPALWWGWRGDFLAVGGVLLGLAALTVTRLSRQPPIGVVRHGYLAAFRLVSSAPGAPLLVLGSTLRAGVQFGWIAFLPAYYTDAFGTGLETVALAWTLGGTGFFFGNLLAGRLAAHGAADGRVAARLVLTGLVMGGSIASASLLTSSLPLALALSALAATGHGVAQGSLVSLLVRRYTPIRGAIMGLNAAGFNLGTAGAVIGGVALAWGYPGLAVALAIMGAGAVAASVVGIRQAEAEAAPAS